LFAGNARGARRFYRCVQVSRRSRFAVLALVAMLAATTCRKGGSARNDAFPQAPVIVISVDTLRADHLPAYGYKGVETPAIDALRRDAILFRNAYSHVPMTLPSHVAVLTGLLPPDNEVRNNLGFVYDSARHPAMSQILKRSGYATGAAVSAYVLRGATGLASSFDSYDDAVNTRNNASVGELSRPGALTAASAERWIGERSGAPFFFFLHLFEPHAPYEPLEPFKSRYASSYDGEIATADQIVGNFLDNLKKTGVYDRALIVFLSDHGEGLGDHGEQEHGLFLYREEIHVPLLVKLPRSARAGETLDTPVQLIDVAPTVLKALGVAVPKEMSGRSLLDSPAAAPRSIYSETLLPRIHFGWSELRSLTNAKYQFIDAPKPELYEFQSDPGERVNVMNEQRRTYVQMRDAMASFHENAAAPSHVDPEDAAKLAALGYIGEVRTTANGPLPDPKDMVGALEQMKVASHLEQAHRLADAAPIYEALVRENPRYTDGWLKLAVVHEQMGQLDRAIADYKKALESSPQLAHEFALSIGKLQLRLGKLDDAEAHAKLAVSHSPGAAHLLLARIALARNDLAGAHREAEAAMQENVRSADAAVVLAQVLTAGGHLREALQTLDNVQKQASASGVSAVENLAATRGDVLARMGDDANAETAFHEELNAFPHNRDAYTKLAILYVTESRVPDARKTLERMVRANPGPESERLAAETFNTVELPTEAARFRRAAAR
jgi:arylsulfatase A-like enzyme/Tfp pilus assembly protein PilF